MPIETYIDQDCAILWGLTPVMTSWEGNDDGEENDKKSSLKLLT
jgi:hypothetical protein